MIQINDQRIETSSGYKYEQVNREVTPLAALRSLVVYELGYGGALAEVTPTKVVVHTRVMSKTDIVTFTGQAEEMQLLYNAAQIHQVVRSQINADDLHAAMSEVLGDQMGTPLIFCNMLPLFVGRSAVLTVCMVFKIELTEQIARLSLEDLFAAIEMAQTDGLSYDDVFALLCDSAA